MANLDGAFGLKPINSPQGSVKRAWYDVLAAAGAIYTHDPVKRDSGGGVTVATAGDALLGAAMGFMDSAGVPQSYYPGGNATGYKVCVADDPDQEFLVQEDSGGGDLALADRGLNADLVAGTGNTTTGLSGWELDSSTKNTTNTLVMRIIDLLEDPMNAVGTNAKWIVKINLHQRNTITGV